jgi:hypothetical protein
MVKAIPYLLGGIVIGGGLVWVVYATPSPSLPLPGPQAQVLTCDTSELKLAQQKIAELESELVVVKNAAAPMATSPEQPASHDASQIDSDESLKWKVSAIEKFVPLTDEQRERLRDKYAKERQGEGEGATESLDDILGAESAKYYREQVQVAFKRVQDEEVEREVVWLSRKLTLSTEQESSVKAILSNVEAEVSQGRSHSPSGATPQDRVKSMIAENRRRTELRNEQLKQVLSADQFRSYLQSEAESSSADVEVFHDAGGAEETPTR